jgi:hypothetical protein
MNKKSVVNVVCILGAAIFLPVVRFRLFGRKQSI